jgi:hypothetical protein
MAKVHDAADLFGANGTPVNGKALPDQAQREFLDALAAFRTSLAQTYALAANVEEFASRAVLHFDLPPKEKKRNVIKDLLTYFDQKHQGTIRNPDTGEPERAKIDGSKDAGIMHRLLATYPPDRLQTLIDQFFALDDNFIREKTGYTVAAFSTRIPAMLSARGLPAKRVGVTRNTESNGQYAERGAEMIQKAYRRS